MSLEGEKSSEGKDKIYIQALSLRVTISLFIILILVKDWPQLKLISFKNLNFEKNKESCLILEQTYLKIHQTLSQI